jgi:uncharacterized protein YoxC
MSDTILTLIAIGGAIGSIVVFLNAKYEFVAQRKKTEQLTKMTSDLTHKVRVLATGLDQRISRLQRIRDLSTGLTQAVSILRQESQPLPSKLAAAIQIEMTKPELIALANASGDDSLQKIGNAMVSNVENVSLPTAWNERIYNALSIDELIKFMAELDEIRNRQYTLATQVHTRIIELIEDATNVSESL